MKKQKQEKTLEELLENPEKINGDELGRLALLTYAEEMSASRSGRDPKITMEEFTGLYSRILDEANGKRKHSLTDGSARGLFLQQKLEHAERTAEIMAQGAFNRFYTYLYCLAQDEKKERIRLSYIMTPVIITAARYNELVKAAGSETPEALADAYAPDWLKNNQEKILHERGAYSGFAIMQHKRAVKGSDVDMIIETGIDQYLGDINEPPSSFLEDSQRTDIFYDFLFAMAYYFRLKEILIALGESYQIDNLPGIIRQDITENFLQITKIINDNIDGIENLRKETGPASAVLGVNYWKVNIDAVMPDDKEKALLKSLYSSRNYWTDINLEDNIKRRAAELTAAELGRLQNHAGK